MIWDEYGFRKPIPESVINFSELPKKIEIVPVIYITNETMQNVDSSTRVIEDLAFRIHKKVNAIAAEQNITIHELQIDCDWTKSSERNYFHLLKALNQLLEKNQSLSATIRLHQVKYKEQTGIPPVDKGVLMVYNMGKLTDVDEQNSIFNKETTKKYLYGFHDYDLPLSLALPAFSWLVQYHNDNIKKVITNVSAEELDTLQNLEKTAHNRYEVKENTVIKNRYFAKGSTIRLEYPAINDLQWAMETFTKEIKQKTKPYEIIFYNLEADYLTQLPAKLYEN